MQLTGEDASIGLAIDYLEKRLNLRDQQLESILKNPTATISEKKEAAKLYTETAWLVEYMRSLSPLACFTLLELMS